MDVNRDFDTSRVYTKSACARVDAIDVETEVSNSTRYNGPWYKNESICRGVISGGANAAVGSIGGS